MWPDNETERDFLNFSGVADTIGEIIVQADGRPISIGISGAWGIGKSSMIKLTKASLAARPKSDGQRDFIFVEFNAWLYQGYDDARAALMDVIAERLAVEAEERKTGSEKVRELLGRINWFRAAKLVAGSAASLALGIPPTGLLGELLGWGQKLFTGPIDGGTLKDGKAEATQVAEAAKGLWKPKPDTTPPKEIQALRDTFEELLDDLGVTLVVLIDDLDRCLPETTISTLEAVRLFLFLKNTAFVIAADQDMIKHAVRRHFKGVTDERLVTSYFDKLIQVPIRVPALGTHEVRAYMMLLFVDNSTLPENSRDTIRAGVAAQLQQAWQGKRVDRAFVQTLHANLPAELVGQLDLADRLAPLMATATDIAGNPRLIKRFLNALAIRMSISRAQGVGVDEAVLAKLLLFERLGNAQAYSALMAAVGADDGGKPTFLGAWEKELSEGKDIALASPWNDHFVMEWLLLPPLLADKDLRGALYVSREHAPLVTPADRLSTDAAELLIALLEHPDMAGAIKAKLAQIPRPELAIIMDRLLERARQEQEWGVPPILEACLVISEVEPAQGLRLAALLRDRPSAQIRASIVPKIGDQPWASEVFNLWLATDVGKPVKVAIKKAKE